MKKQTLAFLTLVFITAIASAAQNATVVLRFDPDHFLVTLNTEASLTVTNIGQEPVQLSGEFRVHVLGPSGAVFDLTEPTHENLKPDVFTFAQPDDARLVVAAQRTQTFYLRTPVNRPIDVFKPLFLTDPHFDTPGTYFVRAELLTRDPAVSFISGQTTLKVDTPQGRDAEALAFIRAAAENDHSVQRGAHIARSILTQYADSAYAPFWVEELLTTDENQRELLYKDAIQRTPESYATELKLALLTRDQETLMGNAIIHFDLQTALAYREKAKALADDLSKSRFPYAVAAATAALDELPTPGQLQRQYSDRIARFSAQVGSVVPFVQCVDRGTTKDDPMITLFGYDNPNSLGKYVASGASNRLRPDDATGTLPTYFGLGHNPRPGDPFPVAALTKGDVMPSWSLDGHVAAVTTATPLCPPLPQASQAVTPLFDCISKKGNSDNFTADFGYDNPKLVPVRIPSGSTNFTSVKGTAPTVFLPGEHHGVLTLNAKKDTLPSWTLQGQTATASATAIQCAADHSGGN